MQPLDDEARQSAYFRFGVISPLLSPEADRTLAEALAEQSARTWTLADGRERRYAAGTIEEWLYRYRRGGFEALVDAPRRDCGTFPGVPEKLAEAALGLFAEHPDVRTAAAYGHLRGAGLIPDGHPSRSTFYRWAAQARPARGEPGAGQRERRAFEAGWSGALWQADIMYGPGVPCRSRDGRQRQAPTYLVAVLDDYSRLLCEGRFFHVQTLEAWLEVLRAACCRRGIPEKLYCDNGQVFTSAQIRRIGAVLGVQVIHTAVRDAAAKGKIERFFRTVRTRFLEPLELSGLPADLEALNRAFRAWAETHYNGAVHSAHGQTPQDRWIEGAARLRTVDPGEAEGLFLFETERTVKKDGTFSLQARRFETDGSLVGRRVLVRFEPLELKRVEVWFEGAFRGRAAELDRHANDGRLRQPQGGNTP